MRGFIYSWPKGSNYGHCVDTDCNTYFCHRDDVLMHPKFQRLRPGFLIEFDIIASDEKPRAYNIVPLKVEHVNDGYFAAAEKYQDEMERIDL